MLDFIRRNKVAFILLIVLFAVIVCVFLYVNRQKENESNTAQPQKTTNNATPSATPSAEKKDSTQEVDDTAALKTAVSKKTGIPEANIAFSISKNTGKYATGNVNTKGEEIGGGYWLAVKTEAGWLIVYDGQAQPECSKVDPYDFPVDMVPECYDANFNVITR